MSWGVGVGPSGGRGYELNKPSIPSPITRVTDKKTENVDIVASGRDKGEVAPIASSSLPKQDKSSPVKMSSFVGKNSHLYNESINRRPIYPNFPFSPFTSPGTSPFAKRRQFKESQRVSVERIGEDVQLNQYRLKEPIGLTTFNKSLLLGKEKEKKNIIKVTTNCRSRIVWDSEIGL